MKLVVRDRLGSEFYVFKPGHRPSDPPQEVVDRSVRNSRMYTKKVFEDLEANGLLLRPELAALNGFVLVYMHVPAILGGSAEAFWKLFQRRYGLRHASSAIDVQGNPAISELAVWIRTVEPRYLPFLPASGLPAAASDSPRPARVARRRERGCTDGATPAPVATSSQPVSSSPTTPVVIKVEVKAEQASSPASGLVTESPQARNLRMPTAAVSVCQLATTTEWDLSQLNASASATTAVFSELPGLGFSLPPNSVGGYNTATAAEWDLNAPDVNFFESVCMGSSCVFNIAEFSQQQLH